MAKKIEEQYNEIFKVIGDKVGFRNFNYKDYLNLKEKKSDDTRLKNFDKYLEENLPFKESTDEDFKNSVNILNSRLREEDKIVDNKSFFKVGIFMFKKDEEPKVSKTSPAKTEVKKEKKTSLFKRITKKIPSGAIGISVLSVGVTSLTIMLGSYAGWPAAAMLGAFNLTFVIPQAIILSYVGINYLSKKIKDGSIKRWFKSSKTKKEEKELEKVKAKDTSISDLDRELFGVLGDYEEDKNIDVDEPILSDDYDPKKDVPFMKDPHASVDENIKEDTKLDDKKGELREPIETEFVNKESSDLENKYAEPKEEIKEEEASASDEFEPPVVSEQLKEENDMHFSPRRQMVINDLDNTLVNYSNDTERMIQDNLKAKKDLANFKRKSTRSYNNSKNNIIRDIEESKKNLETIISQTESYTKIYDKAIIETKEYKDAMQEREEAIRKLQELKEKEQTLLNHLENNRKTNLEEVAKRQQEIGNKNIEIATRQSNYDERKDILKSVSTKEEEKRVDNRNIEVKTNDGETKTIYVEPPRRFLDSVVYEDESSKRR